MKTLVAILAAGESKRMGQPKLCLPWGKTTILGHIREQWLEAGAENILIIHAPGESPVTRELDRLGVAAENRAPTLAMERGMMGSVVTAATRALAEPSLTHLIISLGDQPQIQSATMKKLLRTCVISPGELVRVVHDGKAGHPLALPAELLPELSITPAETLRDFLRLRDMLVCDLTIADSGVLLDVDTPADYTRATQPLNL
jgi:molybdenum cofactor cytidylyltransferase